jgi:hypothetical protein
MTAERKFSAPDHTGREVEVPVDRDPIGEQPRQPTPPDRQQRQTSTIEHQGVGEIAILESHREWHRHSTQVERAGDLEPTKREAVDVDQFRVSGTQPLQNPRRHEPSVSAPTAVEHGPSARSRNQTPRQASHARCVPSITNQCSHVRGHAEPTMTRTGHGFMIPVTHRRDPDAAQRLTDQGATRQRSTRRTHSPNPGHP